MFDFSTILTMLPSVFDGSIFSPQANLTITTFDFSTILTILLSVFTFDGSIFPPQAKLTNEYDFIIIGGGTAGCVVAARLAVEGHSVLVAENGEIPNALSLAPEGFVFQPTTSADYNYQSTDDPYAYAQGNKTRITAGKGLGGSSILNHLVYDRCSPSDYDEWAEIMGDDSWTYNNLLPYFIKIESMLDPVIAKKYSKYHGTDGPIGLTRLLSDDDMVKDFLKAQEEAGNPTIEDINSDTNTGYTQPQYTIARDHQNKTGGIRQSTSYSYLSPIKDLPNLHVSTETTVRRIIIEDNIAVGVEAVHKGETYRFKAKNEVILSAGTFNSPQILMLSGIGPKEHLESLGIQVKADLPVGENLIMPSGVVIVTKTKQHLSPINLVGISPALDPTRLPFPVILGSAALNKTSNIPNYMGFHLNIAYGTPFELLACSLVYGYNLDICLKWQKQTLFHDSVFSFLINLEAKSTGAVRLNSTDISDSPVIRTGFYDKPEDLDNFVKIVLDFIKFVKSETFSAVDAELVGLDLEECVEHDLETDEFWKCYVKHRTISPFLYAGTCAMGSVVDAELRVKNVSNLRVVDSSVIPKPMHGAYNAPVIVLAEKIAADLKAEYKTPL